MSDANLKKMQASYEEVADNATNAAIETANENQIMSDGTNQLSADGTLSMRLAHDQYVQCAMNTYIKYSSGSQKADATDSADVTKVEGEWQTALDGCNSLFSSQLSTAVTNAQMSSYLWKVFLGLKQQVTTVEEVSTNMIAVLQLNMNTLTTINDAQVQQMDSLVKMFQGLLDVSKANRAYIEASYNYISQENIENVKEYQAMLPDVQNMNQNYYWALIVTILSLITTIGALAYMIKDSPAVHAFIKWLSSKIHHNFIHTKNVKFLLKESKSANFIFFMKF